jgi:hypothetical protein
MINSAGRYRAKAIEADLRVSKNGNEMVVVTFHIPSEETNLTWFGTFSSTKGSNVALRALRAMGWSGDDITDLSDCTKSEVELVVEMETWEGETRAKVKWVNAPSKGVVGDAMDAARKASFAERLKGQIAMLDSGEGDSFGGDDIPF